MTATMASPETGPSVPGVHTCDMPIRGKLPPGVVAIARNLSFDQPRPNGPNGSSLTLASPHDVISFTAQSPALRKPGELVTRGP